MQNAVNEKTSSMLSSSILSEFSTGQYLGTECESNFQLVFMPAARWDRERFGDIFFLKTYNQGNY